MTLGEKIKQARLEAGLSQRQLCGDEVTRNMLSQIENGAAQPSMGTLSYFAARLGKTVSYFLEEDTVRSPNQDVMAKARNAALSGSSAEVAQILQDYRSPDEIFDAEYRLLLRLGMLEMASDAAGRGQSGYATEILEDMGPVTDGYCAKELEHRRLLLLGQVRPQKRGEICRALPSIDAELLLRGREALDRGDFDRSEHLLEAAEDHESAEWNFLRGELYLARQQYGDAVSCYHKAESDYPEKCAIRLERCYRELKNFEQAYFYACKQRG